MKVDFVFYLENLGSFLSNKQKIMEIRFLIYF